MAVDGKCDWRSGVTMRKVAAIIDPEAFTVDNRERSSCGAWITKNKAERRLTARAKAAAIRQLFE